MTFNNSGKREDTSYKLRLQQFPQYKEQTKLLEGDIVNLEENFRELKFAVEKDKEQREKSLGSGFWQSGKKGSLTTYATDVLNQNGKKITKRTTIKILKEDVILVPEANKGPGNLALLAKRGLAGDRKDRIKTKDNTHRCGQCEDRSAHVSCIECGEDYCAACFAAFHLKGALKKHRSMPLGSRDVMTPRRIVAAKNLLNQQSNLNEERGGDVRIPDKRMEPVRPSEQNHVTNPSSVGNGNLFDGKFDEEESAQSFQQALKAWRRNDSGDNNDNQRPQAAPSNEKTAPPSTNQSGAPIGVATATETTETTENRQQIEIKFTSKSRLTYSEKLLLKKHRRMELGPLPSRSATSQDGTLTDRSTHSPDHPDQNDPSNEILARINLREMLNTGRGSASDTTITAPQTSNRDFSCQLVDESVDDRGSLSVGSSLDSSSTLTEVTELGAGKGRERRALNSRQSAHFDRTDVSSGLAQRLVSSARLESRVEINEVTKPLTQREMRGLERSSTYHVSEVLEDRDIRASQKKPKNLQQRRALIQPKVRKDAFGAASDQEPETPHAPHPPTITYETPVMAFKKSRSKKAVTDSARSSATDASVESSMSSRRSTQKSVTSSVAKDKQPSSRESIREKSTSSLKATEASQAGKQSIEPSEQPQVSKSTRGKLNSSRGKNSLAVSKTSVKDSVSLDTGDEDRSKQSDSRPKSRANSKASSKAKDHPRSGANSRASSRLANYGEGFFTKVASEDLHMVSSSGMAVDVLACDLGNFFTVGVVPDADGDKMETLVTPRSSRVVPTPRSSGVVMAPRSTTPNPLSGRASAMGHQDQLKVSNRLYQMGPRSWKPEASLGQTVSDQQLEPIMKEVNMAASEQEISTEPCDTVIAFSLSDGITSKKEPRDNSFPSKTDKLLETNRSSVTPKKDKSLDSNRSSVTPKIDKSLDSTRSSVTPKMDKSLDSTRSSVTPKIDKSLDSTRSSVTPKVDDSLDTTKSSVTPKMDKSLEATRISASSNRRKPVDTARSSVAKTDNSLDTKRSSVASKTDKSLDKTKSSKSAIQEKENFDPSVSRDSTSSRSTLVEQDMVLTDRNSSILGDSLSRPTSSRNGRLSQMIVIDGDDMSVYDDLDYNSQQQNNDEEELDKLDTEVASEAGLLTNREAELQMVDNDAENDGSTTAAPPTNDHKALKSNRSQADSYKLRESQLMNDFEEMEAKINDEEFNREEQKEVRALH